MPQSIVFAAPKAIGYARLNAIARAALGDIVQDHGTYKDSFWVRGNDSEYVLFSSPIDESDNDEYVYEYMSNDDLDAAFRQEAHEKTFYSVMFRGLDLVKRVMMSLLRGVGGDAASCWIDTDYGWVIRGDDFLQHLEHDADWDWRHPAESNKPSGDADR
jgi:hypothetical protein